MPSACCKGVFVHQAACSSHFNPTASKLALACKQPDAQPLPAAGLWACITTPHVLHVHRFHACAVLSFSVHAHMAFHLVMMLLRTLRVQCKQLLLSMKDASCHCVLQPIRQEPGRPDIQVLVIGRIAYVQARSRRTLPSRHASQLLNSNLPYRGIGSAIHPVVSSRTWHLTQGALRHHQKTLCSC